VLLVLLVAVTAICAIWETALRHQASGTALTIVSALDYAYAPFTYLVPQAAMAYSQALSLPQAIARLVGPLIPLLSLFWLVRERVLLWLAELVLRTLAKGYCLIEGADGSADALALASSREGAAVVLADASLPDDDDRKRALGTAGVICLGDCERALARAGAVAVWHPRDADNIARAADLRSRHNLAVGEIDLLVSSTELHHALLQSPDLMLDRNRRLRPHSVAGTAVRAALGDARLPELALTQGQSRVTLCLWGDGDALVWAAETALRQFWSVQLGAPRILWVRAQADGLPEALESVSRHAAAVFGDGPQQPQIALVSAEAAVADAAITCHLIDAGDADATAAQGFALAARLRQAHAAPAPVQPILATACPIAPLFATETLVFASPIILGAGLTVTALRDRAADQAAAEIALEYDRQFGDGGAAPASGRWQDLPETYVAANRAAADHRAIKRWDAAASGLEGEALIEALAQAEHNRWSAERLLAGWAPAGDGARDNARRLHPDLRPWADLGEKAREKDRGAVGAVV
jgi:hypothetical protein